MHKNNENNGFKRITQEENAEKCISAYQSSLNDLQLYELYCSIPKWTVDNPSRIYPKYVCNNRQGIFCPTPS